MRSSLETADFIRQPNISADDAPDYAEVKRVGNVECHFALKGNLNTSHPEQQDRMAIHALPGVGTDQYETIITSVFERLFATSQTLYNQPGFTGNACAMMMMLDPLSGNMAIGSKGDMQAYLILQPRWDAKAEPIITTLSSPFTDYLTRRNEQNVHYVISAAAPIPPMWGQRKDCLPADSYRPAFPRKPMEECADFARQEDVASRPFALINLPRLIADIAAAQPALRRSGWEKFRIRPAHAPGPEEYTASILFTSDGITTQPLNTPLLKDIELPYTRLLRLAGVLNKAQGNKAEHLLNALLPDYAPNPHTSCDNLSATVLHDLRFGMGETIAIFGLDGHYADGRSPHEGSIAVQALLECFEEVMQKMRAQHNAPTRHHRDAAQQPYPTTEQQR